MKKLAAAIIVLIIVGVSAALAILYFHMGRVVKMGIETMGPRVTKCDVTVRDIDFKPLRGTLHIQGLVLGNPDGFKTDSAFRIGDVRVALEPRSILSDKVRIHEIIVDAPEITYEIGVGKTNIGTIQKNVETFLAQMGVAGAEETKPKETVEGGRQVAIDHVVVRNGRVRVSGTMLQGAAVALSLPKLELRDIGKERPVTAAEAGIRILNRILYGVIDLARDNSDMLKQQLEGIGDILKQSGGDLKGSASSVIDGVRGMFGKDK